MPFVPRGEKETKAHRALRPRKLDRPHYAGGGKFTTEAWPAVLLTAKLASSWIVIRAQGASWWELDLANLEEDENSYLH
ncbi:hypothetical protein AbraIFM66950_007492 [Aspergillus brasiliensis]|nr:hypothetical protein AbraIFM66950_007492 [Aspergillus brasiliensis]